MLAKVPSIKNRCNAPYVWASYHHERKGPVNHRNGDR